MKDMNIDIIKALSTISNQMIAMHNVAKTKMRIWCETTAKYGMNYFSGSNCCKLQSITILNMSKEASNAPALAINLSNFLQKQAFYLLFWGATHGLHTIIKNVVPDPVAYVFPMLSGAITQGYYNCPTQNSIETRFPNTSMFTGAINGLACCLITSTILNAYLGAVVGGLTFMLFNDKLMCRIEGMALALSTRTTESGLSLTTLKNFGSDLKDIATGVFVERLAKKDFSLQHFHQ